MILFKDFNIVLNIIILHLSRRGVLLWLKMVYKNYKIKCKTFNHPMKKIIITLWNV